MKARGGIAQRGLSAFVALHLAGWGLASVSPAASQTVSQVRIPLGENAMTGVLFAPEGAGPSPAIIVLHTAYGRIEQPDEDYARKLAREGFAALAVNYLEIVGEQNRWSPAITRQLSGVVGWLKRRPEVAGKPVGAVGFSLGAHAISLSAVNAQVRAVVVYYGGFDIRAIRTHAIPAQVRFPVDHAADVKAPVLLLHGDKDDETPLLNARNMEGALKAAGKTVELVVFPGVYHRFDRGPPAGAFGRTTAIYTYVYDRAATQQAWEKTLAWFRRYLAG